MRRLLKQFVQTMSLFLVIMAVLPVNAQRRFTPLAPKGVSDFTITMANDVQVSPKILEFDVFLLDADPAETFEMAAFQAGIVVNPGIYNGGTITISVVAGSSTLTNVAQQPTAPVWSQAQNTIKLTPKSAPGAGNGSIISQTAPGTKIIRLRITNTNNFTAGSTANLTFNFTTSPYPTKVNQYISGTNTILVCNATNSYSNLDNIVLNPPAPVAFNVTGGGSYCQGGAGLPVGIDGSQAGVTYELWLDGTATGTTLPGTGAALLFGDQPVGTYTVKGTNAGGTTSMTGSAVITETIPSPVSVSIVESANPVIAGTDVTFTASPVNGGTPSYQWYVGAGMVGLNQDTYTYAPGNGDVVKVVMTSSLACVSGNPATSNEVTMIVNPAGPVDYAWNGTTNSWTTAGNWTPNGVPGALDNVVIGAGEVAYPTLTAPATIASLVIENGGSFIGSEFLTTGTALVKRALPSAEFHFVSSPVTSVSFGNAFPLNQDAVWVRAYNEPSGDWVNQVIADNFAVGKGYSVKMDAPQTAMFSGTLNAAAVNNTLSKQNVSGEMNRVGWNLLGNPFTSAVDWNQFVLGGSVDGSVYIWNGSNYVSWNGGAGALTGGIIPAQNGFFVKTSMNNESLTIPLAARVHSTIPFYKSSVDNLIELRADGNNYSDFTFVHFNSEATHGFDTRFDAFKLYGINEAPQLYSMISGEILSINERPMDGNDIVQLGFSCGNSGSYTFTASGMESFDASKPIFLEDSKLNVYQDLRSNPVYGFSYTAGENANRFKLVFGSVGIGEGNALNVGIFAERKNIHVTTPENFRGTVQVYDLLGKMVTERQVSGSGETIISMAVPTATYLVKATGANGTITRKVVLN